MPGAATGASLQSSGTPRGFRSHPSELNRQPAAYEAAALPIELGWRQEELYHIYER